MSVLIIPFSLQQLYFKQYYVLAKVNNYVLPVLIDTGSSISCIQTKYCSFLQPLAEPIKIARCFDANYDIYESTIVNITFDNQFYFDLSLFVHNPEKLDIPMLLGMDFLDVLSHYILNYDYLCLVINNYQHNIPRILLTYQEIVEQLEL